ncbi:MAG: hypothetical protein PUD15_07225 [Prevotella sp.]|nr:hypothetical protein [Prevotella sp.]
MKKKMILGPLCMGALLFSSCSTSNGLVKSTEAQHYYYSNEAPDEDAVLKITNQSDFDRYFGEAAVMGKNGQPTKINWSRQMVIAKVLKTTNRCTEISNMQLRETGSHELTLSYCLHSKAPQSYSIKPMAMLIVDKKYADYTVKEKAMENCCVKKSKVS